MADRQTNNRLTIVRITILRDRRNKFRSMWHFSRNFCHIFMRVLNIYDAVIRVAMSVNGLY